LIADGQLYPQFPVEAYLVYRFLQDSAAQLSDPEDKFFLKHIDDKGDHLLVDEDLNITGIIDWLMAPVVPRREALALSLVSADMRVLCDGHVSLSAKDMALSNALREKGSVLASHAEDEKARRFFWGLGLEPKWAYALPLANAILEVFGVEQGWDEWKVGTLKGYGGDERLKALVKEPGKARNFTECSVTADDAAWLHLQYNSTYIHYDTLHSTILGGQGLGTPQITIR
jgi:hypothetical protein